ncbi:hypothetical protein KKF61_07145, partial [Patescibacteria group bacterium]|nr:hypothetical protein [Patescibacteria group bacterium]
MSGEGIHNPSDLTDVEVDLAAITAALVVIDNEIANLDADLVLVQNDVTDIMAVTDALPTLTTMSGESTTTVINTEYDLYINNAPVGVYRPIVV